jgi:uncharacterized protein YbjT (DUF2867 family)
MYAVIGITGQVGGAVARKLLADKQCVRAVLRDANRGLPWAVRGCEMARADLHDAASLTAAFKGIEGVFAMLPPIFDPSPGFPEARALIASLRSALAVASPPRVVCLSTVGAQAKRQNLLTQLAILEQELGELSLPVTFLRPAWFMENFACAQYRRVLELPAAPRQTFPNGRHRGRRACRRRASAGRPEGRTRGRA